MYINRIRLVTGLALFVLTGTATAAALPETSLNNCQNAVKTATKAFVTKKVTAIGTCLQAVSTQIVKKNAGDAHLAAGTCVTQFRRINDSRGQDKQLSDKLAAAVIKKCDPSYQTQSGSFPNTHTVADIIGSGASVLQPLDAENLNAWCSHYGGDGAISSLQEWIDCLAAAAECDVDSTIASQYPRALEWLNLVKPSMQALVPPVADPTKISDAVAGLDAVKAEIDGPNNDNIVSIQCGGNAQAQRLKTGQTQCDQGNGTMGACPGSPAGQDGSLGKGLARSYTDNLDGTVTDNKTGLMWEKLSHDGTIHDYNTSYSWYTAFTTKIATLNSLNFAGHNDWRLPNINELESIANYGGSSPAVDTAFNTNCTANCSVLACSCTLPDLHWSSSTVMTSPTTAFIVLFDRGVVTSNNKSNGNTRVRAVRGGS